MRGDNAVVPMKKESGVPRLYDGLNQQQMDLSNRTSRFEKITDEANAIDQGKFGHFRGSNISLPPLLPKITTSNWTVSGIPKSENDIPGKWFMISDDEEQKQKQKASNKTTWTPREPDGRSSPKSVHKVSIDTEVPRKHSAGGKDGVEDKKKNIELSKYLSLKKKYEDSQERLTNCLAVFSKWNEMADDCKQKYLHLQRESVSPGETLTQSDMDRNEKKATETVDMWKSRAIEYKAKYNTANKQLKTFKVEFDQAKRIEGEVNSWIHRAKEYRKKYTELSKEYDNLLTRFKEMSQK